MTTHIITPQEWGPHGWKFIHYVSLGYPENPTEEDKHKYKMLEKRKRVFWKFTYTIKPTQTKIYF